MPICLFNASLKISRRYRLETERKSCAPEEMISVVNVVPHLEEQNDIGTGGQGDVDAGGMRSFESGDETSSVIISVSLSSLNNVEE